MVWRNSYWGRWRRLHYTLVRLAMRTLLDAATVDRLVDAYRAGFGIALAAAYDGERGNPVRLDHEHFDALRNVAGDVGGRPVLVNSEGSALIESDDRGVVADIDTTCDL
ncbi:hypothetical protein [Halobacterium sp. R2-5]|uniref:hypothetical protein n=1 Tax=Halobacterium sp. R2-5 TaxID=2715751 RepID=UPI00141EC854|nr:hypothetical protein [Halobacterium sp. R2-5]NIC00898.1 hypothetical protein [Halobacterium sp. R2-5]